MFKTNHYIRSILFYLIKFIVRLFFRIEVVGIEHIPHGSKVYAANHISLFDAFIIAKVLEYREALKLIVLIKDKYTKRIKLFTDSIGLLSVGADTMVSLEQTKDALKQGFNLLVFPEGTRSDIVKQFKKTFVKLAQDSNSKIVPISIQRKSNKFRISFIKWEMEISNQPANMIAEEVRTSIIEDLSNNKI